MAQTGAWDWPTYGHDAQHTFDGRTTLTKSTVKKLSKAWWFPTGDAVTADPTVVNGTVYVGSWDDYFYALNLRTGALEWKRRLDSQNAVTPYPGQSPRPVDSDGGLVTSSAWYQPGQGSRPPLVIFGGGYTLYALNARTGAIYWQHAYTGHPGPPQPNADGVRIFSSPIVVDGKVIFAVDPDGQKGYAGYVAAASLATGDPVWMYQTDINSQGQVQYDGCGGVWSSPTLLPSEGLVVVGVADCDFHNPPPTAETVLALRVSNGERAWIYRPARPDNGCDLDFGATANAGLDSSGQAVFLGLGAKDGTYYSINPANGKLRWATNVVFGGFSGGFIATAAYDGKRVYGSTAVGDFGRFEGSGEKFCDPGNPRDTPNQEPSAHAFNASSGSVAWQADLSASFASTTVANGMTFNAPALQGPVMYVRDASTGAMLSRVTLQQVSWSSITTVGDAVVLGTGSSYEGTGDGIEVLTPGGAPPVVPS